MGRPTAGVISEYEYIIIIIIFSDYCMHNNVPLISFMIDIICTQVLLNPRDYLIRQDLNSTNRHHEDIIRIS